MATLPTITAEVAFGLEAQEVGEVAGLVLEGTNDYADTPDAAAFDITGDVDLVWRGVSSDWTGGGVIQALVGKWDETANECSYLLGMDATGNVAFYFSTDGSTVTTETGSAPEGGFVADRPYWMRGHIDVNDGGGNRVVTLYYSDDVTNDPDQVAWRTLTVNVTGTTVTLNSGTAKPTVGSTDDEAYDFTGTVYAAEIRDGIGGTVVADPDWLNDTLDHTATTADDTAGNTWTFRGDAGLAQAWYDISAYVRSGSVRRGRQRDLDRFEAGTCTLELENNDRRFDPLYTSGAYYPDVVPERRLRLKATYNSVEYDLFEGLVDGWPQTYPGFDAIAVVSVTATDAFKVLSNATLVSPYKMELTERGRLPAHWWKLDEEDGTVALDATGGEDGMYQWSPSLGQSSIVAFDDGQSVQGNATDIAYVTLPEAALPQTSTYSYELWIQRDDITDNREWVWHWRGSTAATLSSGDFFDNEMFVQTDGTFSFSAETEAGGNEGRLDSTTAVDDGLPHHIVVVRDGDDYELYVDGTSEDTDTDNTSADPYWIPSDTIVTLQAHRLMSQTGSTGSTQLWEGNLQHAILWDGRALTATEVADHYNAGNGGHTGDTTGERVGRILDYTNWPAAKRDVDTGDTTCQGINTSAAGSDALSYLHTVADTEYGGLYVAVDGDVVFRGRHALYETTRSNTSQATFGDGAGELPYADIRIEYDDTELHNEVRVGRIGGNEQTAEDQDSRRRYFPRVLSRTGLEMDSDEQARDQADMLLSIRKDPYLRVDTIVVNPLADPANLYPEVLGRLLEDRITVKRSPQGVGSAIDKEVLIQGITHDFAVDSWVTTWDLGNAEDSQNFLVLDHATLGVLGSNKIGA